MVLAVLLLAAVADVERRDPQVLQEGREVRAGAQRLEAERPGRRPPAASAGRRTSCGDGERQRSRTLIPFSGSVTSRATWLTKVSSVCEPPAPKKPRELLSELM